MKISLASSFSFLRFIHIWTVLKHYHAWVTQLLHSNTINGACDLYYLFGIVLINVISAILQTQHNHGNYHIL